MIASQNELGNFFCRVRGVVREALRDWKAKRTFRLQELAALRADIDRGVADLAEGRVREFDAKRIVEQGGAVSRPLAFRLTAVAEADLAEIWAALATEISEQAATRLLNATAATFERLRHFLVSGPTRTPRARTSARVS